MMMIDDSEWKQIRTDLDALQAVRESRAWVRFEAAKWYAMRVGDVVDMGEGATVEEALKDMEAKRKS